MTATCEKIQLFAQQPSPWPELLRPSIAASVAAATNHKLIVLDDDPTGTQTVYDVPVLTEWSVELLKKEFADTSPCFYILTNSRSLTTEVAQDLNREIARNIKTAAGDEYQFTVVSRSDSTLRGHFPAETDVLNEELGPFHATLLIPYFEAGGRYTIDDTHYVAEGEQLVPAAETPFAADAAFGYQNSNLKKWVEEKTAGRVTAESVVSISLTMLREDGPEAVAHALVSCKPGSVVVVNAADPSDLDVLVAGLLQPDCAAKKFLFRTGAQFVSARLGLTPKGLLSSENLKMRKTGGGLVVVGSYVPKTTQQLDVLRRRQTHDEIELPVDGLLDENRREQLLAEAALKLNESLSADRKVVLFTSRDLVTGDSPEESLNIGRKISDALVGLVRGLSIRPHYLIAKGGITSSDVATRALGVKRAVVAGQILSGVPVWRMGPETLFPGMCYVVFPGNVGGPDALAEADERFSPVS